MPRSSRQGLRVIADVASFRLEPWGRRLLAAEQVDAWIHGQEERGGEPSLWLEGVSFNLGNYEVAFQADTGSAIRITKAIPLDWRSDAQAHISWERPAVSQREMLYITLASAVTGGAVRNGGCSYFNNFKAARSADRSPVISGIASSVGFRLTLAASRR